MVKSSSPLDLIPTYQELYCYFSQGIQEKICILFRVLLMHIYIFQMFHIMFLTCLNHGVAEQSCPLGFWASTPHKICYGYCSTLDYRISNKMGCLFQLAFISYVTAERNRITLKCSMHPTEKPLDMHYNVSRETIFQRSVCI